MGRIGGDEFLILSSSVATPELAMKLAKRLANCLRGPIELAEQAIQVQASIGVVWSAGGDPDPEAR